MRVGRFGQPGKEKPCIFAEDAVFDVSGFGQDIDREFLQTDGLNRLNFWFMAHRENCPRVNATLRLAAPLKETGKLICIGLNYADHARETHASLPTEPIVFFKATSSIVGPNDDLILPRGSLKTDWEVELAVVIGKKTSYVEERHALEHVAGYCLHNDYSERAYQLERGGQWVKGKSCDTFAPLGPWLATPDELGDLDNLRLWLKVNDVVMQDGNTRNLIFKIPFLISYLSQFMSLHPGDIISTGTPAGVGLGMNPQVYLKPGDVVALGIDGLGSSCQHAVPWTPSSK